MKVLLLLIALFVPNTKSAFSQPVADQPEIDPIVLTCPANPAQLASNISKQERQNAFADSLGWPVIERSADIGQHLTSGHFVSVSASGLGYRLRRSSYSEDVLLPNTLYFLEWFSVEYSRRFPGKKAEWTTLLRTLERHRALQKKNSNAASCVTRYRCTSHAHGMSLDLTYRYMSATELAWTLATLEEAAARGEVIYHREMCVKNIHIAVLHAPSSLLATNPQTPSQEEAMLQEQRGQSAQIGGGRR